MDTWFGEHWFELLQTASILTGFFATAHSIRADTNERKIENLFALTESHRQLWTRLYERPELVRVLDDDVNLRKCPVSAEEELFVHLLILHLRAWFKARHAGMEFDDDAVAADIRQFFSRPIPRFVWEKSCEYQDRAFVKFVESNFEPPLAEERAA
jgi:hypothetical protein